MNFLDLKQIMNDIEEQQIKEGKEWLATTDAVNSKVLDKEWTYPTLKFLDSEYDLKPTKETVKSIDKLSQENDTDGEATVEFPTREEEIKESFSISFTEGIRMKNEVSLSLGIPEIAATIGGSSSIEIELSSTQGYSKDKSRKLTIPGSSLQVKPRTTVHGEYIYKECTYDCKFTKEVEITGGLVSLTVEGDRPNKKERGEVNCANKSMSVVEYLHENKDNYPNIRFEPADKPEKAFLKLNGLYKGVSGTDQEIKFEQD